MFAKKQIDNITKDDLVNMNKQLYLSVLYEDYVLLPFKASIWSHCSDKPQNNTTTTIANSDNKSNNLEIDSGLISQIIDDWKLTATVVVTYIEK